MAHPAITKIAIIGCGAMGGGMALLFAEKTSCTAILLKDPSSAAMDRVIEQGQQDGISKDMFVKCHSYEELCKNFGPSRPRVFLWSLPHGAVGDQVLEELMPHVSRGDVILDAANEHWGTTERRQGKCGEKGIRYVGMGVSGGYQGARHGPSICPGSDPETLDIILPLLREAAAKAPDGSPCVAKIGTGGAGHYCKMIHNGIEHGMMSAIAEAYDIMRKGLDMSLDEIAAEFHDWNKAGELQGTYLVRIAAEICATKDKDGQHVLDTVEDKVVQDFTGEEGTGIWSNTEAVDRHVPAPTLTMAHYLRLASGDLAQRRKIHKKFGGGYPPQALNVEDKSRFLKDLQQAVYAACLASFVQGMNVLDKADEGNQFNIDYAGLLQIWRAGCIIQADYILTNVLQPIYKNHAIKAEKNPLYEPVVAGEMKRSFGSLKRVVLKAIEGDHVAASLSASLDWMKQMTSVDLPMTMAEAQLDYFGRHMYDKKGEDEAGRAELGKHHFEWCPA